MPPIVPENIQGRKYEPVGRCIYCGSDGHGRKLGDEHLMPYSLGGNAILPEASCAKCEGVTSYLDGYLANAIFGDYRLARGIQSRNARKRPKTRDTLIKTPSGKLENYTFEAGRRLFPFQAPMPIFELPGILLGNAPTDTFKPGYMMLLFHYVPPDLREEMKAGPDEQVAVLPHVRVNRETFARAIAKIAYCHLVAADQLKDCVLFPVARFILGLDRLAPYLVGSAPGADPPEQALHKIGTYWQRYPTKSILVASVRLFADTGLRDRGFPTYLVAIGEREGPPPPSLVGP